ncbi:MAG: hypothetical protein ACUVUR_01485, partial [bacterium]
MQRRRGKVNCWVLAALAVVSLLLFYIEAKSVRTIRSRLFEKKVQAAKLSARAFSIIKDYRLNILGFPIDS